MSKNHLFIALIITLIGISSGCGEFRKIQKNPDWKVKFAGAMQYYEEKEYYKASVLFEEIIPIIRGSEESEKAQFFQAYAAYYQKQYVMSSHHFRRFYETYNRSEYAQEALYMHAYSLYLQSPAPNLDQSSSFEAISALQTFINRYPTSEYTAKATQIIDDMQFKLETKAFENAKQYYKLERFKAAIVSFENFQRDYPDARYQEEVAFLLVKSEYLLAKQSFKRLQKERYKETIDYYQAFVDSYPQSEFLKEAEGIYSIVLEEYSKSENN
jgi:outer membrane protein assembly factor BamD